MSHTYVILDLSPSAYREIREKLDAAGHQHAFHEEDGRPVIDMHGIAVAAAPAADALDAFVEEFRRLLESAEHRDQPVTVSIDRPVREVDLEPGTGFVRMAPTGEVILTARTAPRAGTPR